MWQGWVSYWDNVVVLCVPYWHDGYGYFGYPMVVTLLECCFGGVGYHTWIMGW